MRAASGGCPATCAHPRLRCAAANRSRWSAAAGVGGGGGGGCEGREGDTLAGRQVGRQASRRAEETRERVRACRRRGCLLAGSHIYQQPLPTLLPPLLLPSLSPQVKGDAFLACVYDNGEDFERLDLELAEVSSGAAWVKQAKQQNDRKRQQVGRSVEWVDAWPGGRAGGRWAGGRDGQAGRAGG